MKSIVAYVRSLLGLCDEPTTRTNLKRDSLFCCRTDDEVSSDEDVPALKRQRQLRKTNYPNIMATKEKDNKEAKNVRYIPIHVEPDYPSTSTPNVASSRKANRHSMPIKLIGVSENGSPGSRYSKTEVTRPVIHAVLDNDDEQVSWIESKPRESAKKVYINLDEEDDENDEEIDNDDVIYVKKVTAPSPCKPYKYLFTKNIETESRDEVDGVEYYRLKKIKDLSNISPRNISKFKMSGGITKSYKKVPTSLPRWMQSQSSPVRSRLVNTNGNARSTLSKVFNLDEKRNYQDLIRRVANSSRPINFGMPREKINLVDDAASFRLTQRSQKKALNEINLVTRDLILDKENEINKEYDPITIASINSSDSEVEIVPSDSSTTSSFKIDPVNSLRDSFRDKDILGADWLARLNTKYKKKKQDTHLKLEDARRESDIISKLNYEQKLAHLEHKLKHELSIPESLIEEVPSVVELPKLTLEQEKLINRALGSGPPGQLMVEKFNLRIHRRDLQTLAGLNWLNDEVINFYMNLLMQRCEERTDLPKVYATNTFFYPKLMQSGQAGLRRWTRKVDIFSHDLMVVPVHLGVHWCVSLVDFRTRRIMYLDSMGSRNQPCLNALLQYLRDEHQDKKGQPFEDKGWTTENLKDIPQQMNGSDCGMFACTFAEFSCRNAPYSFSQSHMPYFRRKAVLEILQGKLLL
ncbi:uncharacterized protein [Battus philenor]|uniref:uncharacterized protein isoform X2 n=1 Tax=Battus philenor TaxID=42288 RepID=UPI0035CFE0DD